MADELSNEKIARRLAEASEEAESEELGYLREEAARDARIAEALEAGRRDKLGQHPDQH